MRRALETRSFEDAVAAMNALAADNSALREILWRRFEEQFDLPPAEMPNAANSPRAKVPMTAEAKRAKKAAYKKEWARRARVAMLIARANESSEEPRPQ